MNKAVLTFLGSDSGFGKKNTSAYAEVNNNLVLIDCGFTVFHEIQEKIDINKYNDINVIITHLHNDHAGSLGQFILYTWFVYRKKVNVISKCKNIKKYLQITGTPDEAYEIKDTIGDLKFIKTNHVETLDSYGFKMNINDKKIVYTGDTNTLKPFLPYLDNTDEFYIDVSKGGEVHIKLEDVLEDLRNIKNNGTNVYLMHIDDKKYVKNMIEEEFYIA